MSVLAWEVLHLTEGPVFLSNRMRGRLQEAEAAYRESIK